MRPLAELPAGDTGGELWLDEEAGVLAVDICEGAELAILSLAYDEMLNRIALRRDPDWALRFMRFVPVAEDKLCLIYEAGALAIGDDGDLLWHTPHFNVGTEVAETPVRDGVVWVRTLWPGREGELFGFLAETGGVVDELPG